MFNTDVMSAEELKIRKELEMDVERDLEAEIKDGIYHLALRLHRLYQHQKKKTLLEVNISIRMEGGTKIEIKEIKKEAREDGYLPASKSKSTQGMVGLNAKKFDWVQSLRSKAHPFTINKKNESTHKAKSISYEHGLNENHKLGHVIRRNCTSSSRQDKSVGNKLLELGSTS
ncbi:Cysteine proteinase [Actinidia chinensis var. chinensis]|uniref:Cysteine proteinase n=1 Tax=Actinidia chinensis var. chinensis TaxID=1590841 RepID=A0A2R6R642_ACTCC|nr:Cysteine proteinase [Actinidia chinensis var. chinensis]